MEFDWESMKKVLDLRSDIIFNFMTSQINREVAAARQRNGKTDALNMFFGDSGWSTITNQDELVEFYKNKIENQRKNAVIRIIKIQSKKYNFFYHLFFITNKTSSNNEWIKSIETAKEEIEKQSDKAVEMALDIIKKRQKTLFDNF